MGKQEGKGRMVMASGEVQEGVWYSGKFLGSEV